MIGFVGSALACSAASGWLLPCAPSWTRSAPVVVRSAADPPAHRDRRSPRRHRGHAHLGQRAVPAGGEDTAGRGYAQEFAALGVVPRGAASSRGGHRRDRRRRRRVRCPRHGRGQRRQPRGRCFAAGRCRRDAAPARCCPPRRSTRSVGGSGAPFGAIGRLAAPTLFTIRGDGRHCSRSPLACCSVAARGGAIGASAKKNDQRRRSTPASRATTCRPRSTTCPPPR